ncbi:hypothetical protein ANCCAN_02961 [Ancylostoma caninum]|uniref:Uncharacterized protein n=1 Tax=Ancylostoma caninum TaxID=29170 RepID=A0A368H5D0_ANCCA|nr:hypothetical protein ANCCAN_02961 [Ancylostoma caninum]
MQRQEVRFRVDTTRQQRILRWDHNRSRRATDDTRVPRTTTSTCQVRPENS